MSRILYIFEVPQYKPQKAAPARADAQARNSSSSLILLIR